jgi:ATP-binding cassette subfamily F protein 3
MITLNNITMGFTGRTLFKDVTLGIFPGERVGLTGPNGAGKSTLFSIIRGEIEPVRGNVAMQKKLNIGYLPQESKFTSQRTVMAEITSGDDRIRSLLDEKRAMEDAGNVISERYGNVLAELEQLGIYNLEHKAEKILSGLGFREEEFHKPILQLSGGWQMRALLAKLLTYSYDILLLDEPTNHLDLSATLWLKDFLKSYDGAFVLISHDRVFLNDVTNYTILLDGESMTKIKGNYESYEKQKEINQTFLERRKKEMDKKRQQLESFARRFHAQPNRAAAVRNKRKMIEKLEDIELARDSESIRDFRFSNITESGYSVVTMRDVAKSYDDKVVYEKLDLEIVKGQKVCLVGPNGAGKSTLLKMLAGAIEPGRGTIRLGHNVGRGYFSQSRMDVLNPGRTVFDEVASVAFRGAASVQIRTLLALFNFRGDDINKYVKVLSGGEKSRLILAKLLIDPPNFMLLDEPTTHLDLDGVRALTAAFREYSGTMCFISHDLFFIREVADHIIEVNAGRIKTYAGGLEYYLHKKGLSEDEAKAVSSRSPGKDPGLKAGVKAKSAGGEEYDNLKAVRSQHQQAKKRLSEIRTKLRDLEQEAKDLDTENYVKSRMMNKLYESRDSGKIKEFGQRLKDIQSRQRDIAAELKSLADERDRISR